MDRAKFPSLMKCQHDVIFGIVTSYQHFIIEVESELRVIFFQLLFKFNISEAIFQDNFL